MQARSISKIIKEMRMTPPTKSDDPRFDELEELAVDEEGEEELEGEGLEEEEPVEGDEAMDDDKYLADLLGEGEEVPVEGEEEEVALLPTKKKKMPSSMAAGKKGRSYLA